MSDTLKKYRDRMKQSLVFIWVGCGTIWVSIATNSDPLFLAGVVTEFGIGLPLWLNAFFGIRRESQRVTRR